MLGHDPYAAKAVEYLLGLGFLGLFAGFWRYVMGGLHASVQPAVVRARVRPLLAESMFRVPDGVLFHPGHTWARPDERGLIAVGVDDFAQQLVGPVAGVKLPAVGTALQQGGPVATLKADSKAVDLLSPVSGRIVEVNPDAAKTPAALNDDPYGNGWLLKIEAPQFPIDRKQLVSGSMAKRWMSSSWDELAGMLTPELGTLMQDGGTPVHGFARGIDEMRWDDIARRFLLS